MSRLAVSRILSVAFLCFASALSALSLDAYSAENYPLLAGDYFAPADAIGCFADDKVWHIESGNMFLRKSGKQVLLFKHMAFKPNGSRTTLLADFGDIPVVNEVAKQLRVDFEIRDDDIKPVEGFIDGQSVGLPDSIRKFWTLTPCSQQGSWANFLLLLGWHSAYEPEAPHERIQGQVEFRD